MEDGSKYLHLCLKFDWLLDGERPSSGSVFWARFCNASTNYTHKEAKVKPDRSVPRSNAPQTHYRCSICSTTWTSSGSPTCCPSSCRSVRAVVEDVYITVMSIRRACSVIPAESAAW